MLLMLRGVPPEALLGSLLAYRAIYYLVPLLFGAVLFGYKELSANRAHLARARERAAMYVAPVAPQIAGALTFLAGTVLLVSGATPAISSRLALLHRFIPLAVLEASNLVGERHRPRPAGARPRPLPPSQGRLLHLLLAARLRRDRLAPQGTSLRGSDRARARARRAGSRAAGLLPADGDSRRALQPRLGREHHRSHHPLRLDRLSRLPQRAVLRRAMVDLRAARQRAANAARVARGHRARCRLPHVEPVAPGAAGTGGGERARTSTAPAPSSTAPTTVSRTRP